jgi:hypothetical protein
MVRKPGKILFIEGSRDETNGDLAEGFKILLEKKLTGKMPRIVMGNGKNETVDKFLNIQIHSKAFAGVKRYVLVDLDKAGDEKTIEQDRKNYKLNGHKRASFYMIQEMEAWFISQAEKVLNGYYKVDVSRRIPKKKANEFSNPDEKISEWLRPLKREYRKVEDGVELLKLLDIEKLQTDFPDVKNLITELSKA